MRPSVQKRAFAAGPSVRHRRPVHIRPAACFRRWAHFAADRSDDGSFLSPHFSPDTFDASDGWRPAHPAREPPFRSVVQADCLLGPFPGCGWRHWDRPPDSAGTSSSRPIRIIRWDDERHDEKDPEKKGSRDIPVHIGRSRCILCGRCATVRGCSSCGLLLPADQLADKVGGRP